MPGKERFQRGLVVNLVKTMPAVVDQPQGGLHPGRLQRFMQHYRLSGGNEGIACAVENEKWRACAVDVAGRAGGRCPFRALRQRPADEL